MTLGERLRLFIVLNRMSVTAFSELYGVHYRALQDYLHDKRKPSADQLAEMSRRGMNIDWLLTGEQRPQIVLSMGASAEAHPITGIVPALPDLERALLNEAVALVDEQFRRNPELMSRMGFNGMVLSIWHLFATYANGVDQIADKIKVAVESGLDARDLAKLVTGPLREHMRASLRRSAAEIMSRPADASVES